MQVTLEAYRFKGNVKMIGIVDSIIHKNTISFKRFDYPSAISYRYGIINLGADSKKELIQEYNNCVAMLDFKFK